MLSDVIAGRILKPEQRAPERDIPSDLSAIAMKALARQPSDRYQSIVELRADVERFFQFRQVSAKEDSFIEFLTKLVRRNRTVVVAVVAAVGAVMLVVGLSTRALLKEQHRVRDSARVAQESLAKLRTEQGRRAEEQRLAAPALVAKARREVELRIFADARQDVDLALSYDPRCLEARLLRAQLMVRDQDLVAAAGELDAYLAAAGAEAEPNTRALAQLCAQALATPNIEVSTTLAAAFADVLARQGMSTLAEDLAASGKQIVHLYRNRLELAWPGCTRHGFTVDRDGHLLLDGLAGRSDVSDLSPLGGLPVARLKLNRTRVLDLSPLKGMPLRVLDLSDTAVRSIDQLDGLPLSVLSLANTRVEDLGPLAGAPLEELDLSGTGVEDLGPIDRAPLRILRLGGTKVVDLVPLAGLPLRELDLGGAPVADLRPLRGASITALRLTGTRVGDLSAIAGMPLTNLSLERTPVSDLLPLRQAPLRHLALAGTAVADLSPLTGKALTALDLSGTAVSDLTPLAGMPLMGLNLAGTLVSSLKPIAGLSLTSLSLADTRVSDLSPLALMPTHSSAA